MYDIKWKLRHRKILKHSLNGKLLQSDDGMTNFGDINWLRKKLV